MLQVEEQRVGAVREVGGGCDSDGEKLEPARKWLAFARYVMPVLAAVFAGYLLLGTGMASRWPLVHDAPLMHYVVWAMAHGQVPYRDIVEMNMPGTYVIEGAAMRVLGGGAFGWWLWDALLGLAAVLSSIWIAGPGRRSAGVVGGGLTYLFHLSDGAWNLGQRDWTVAVLLLLGFGCLFAALRRRQPAWMAGFLCFAGLAASIKPPVLGIAVVFAGLACWLVARDPWGRLTAGGLDRAAAGYRERLAEGCPGPGWLRYAAWSLAGLGLPVALVAGFLLRWGNTREFLAVLHGLVPYYAGLQRMSLGHLLRACFDWKLILLPALAVFALRRSWRGWEACLLLLAAVAGAALFVVQGKGWDYHLYSELAFGLLWATVEFQGALEERRLPAFIAAVTLAFITFAFAPKLLRAEQAGDYPMTTLTNLQQDLVSLGGSGLSGEVQCLDMTLGSCINVLYRMQLVQSTGFIYDFYLFPERGTAVTAQLQEKFLRGVMARPPRLIVLSSQSWPGDAQGYDQLGRWPAFRDYLGSRYRVIREFPQQRQTAGYRIYQLETPVVGSARAAQ